MAAFSSNGAIASGFRLIGAKPALILVWGLVYVLLAVVPQFLLIGRFLPDLLIFYRDAIQAASAGTMPAPSDDLIRMQSQIARFQPLQILAGLIGAAIVHSAVYRAILEPENDRFFYLRLGAQELWVGLVSIVLIVMIALAAIAGAIPAALLTAIVAGVTGGPSSWAAGLMVFLLIFAVMALAIWVALRLSMALPESFALRNFRLFESWEMTKGLGWQLFGVAASLFGILIAGEFVFFTLLGAGGASALTANLEGIKAFFEHPPSDWLGRAAPWIALFIALYTVVTGIATTIMTAPFATIYRELVVPAAREFS